MVPFPVFTAQYRGSKSEIDAAAVSVLNSTQCVFGQYAADFEKALAKYSGAADRVFAALREALAAERKAAVRRS